MLERRQRVPLLCSLVTRFTESELEPGRGFVCSSAQAKRGGPATPASEAPRPFFAGFVWVLYSLGKLLFLNSYVPLAARRSLTFKDSSFSLALGTSVFGVVSERWGHWMRHPKALHPAASSLCLYSAPCSPIDASYGIGQLGTVFPMPSCLSGCPVSEPQDK